MMVMRTTILSILLLLAVSRGANATCSLSFAWRGSSSINIKASGVQTSHIADVLDVCDDPVGYSIQLSSSNNSRLVGARASYPYQVSYNLSQPFSLEIPYTLSYPGPSDGTSKNLSVVFNGISAAVAGIYHDTLDVTISAR
jgi:spore coat protein U-like protein